jgi:hypothetical protein
VRRTEPGGRSAAGPQLPLDGAGYIDNNPTCATCRRSGGFTPFSPGFEPEQITGMVPTSLLIRKEAEVLMRRFTADQRRRRPPHRGQPQ